MPFEFRLSSGAFGLPADARSVDWMVLNNTGTEQPIRVTGFAAPVGSPKHQLPPGPGRPSTQDLMCSGEGVSLV